MNQPVNLTITDFYRICRNSVRFFPADIDGRTCHQIQAWRVLQRDPRMMHEIGTDTLGAVPTDADSPFFWSRKWENESFDPGKLSYDYPLLTAFEIVNETTGSVFQGNVSRTYTVELAVLEAFKPESCVPNSESCEGRPINQIFLDTEMLLDSVVGYIGGTVAAKLPDNKVVIGNLDMLKAEYGNSVDVLLDYGRIWQSQNPRLVFSRVEFPAKNIYGTKTRVTFKAERCPTVNFNFKLPEPGIVGFEAGCTNC